jgi:RNA polymerase sigma factor (sigma-70 family)
MPTTDIDRILSTAHRAQLVRLCTAISGAPEAAEDLAQETLLEAWRNQDKLTDPSGADRWLAAIARNVCRRWLRSRGQHAARFVPQTDRLDSPDPTWSGSERVELRALLESALSTVPDTTREVLISRYVHDASYADIGKRLGLSAEATAMRASRGRSALRQVLKPQPEVEDVPPPTPTTNRGWVQTTAWCAACGGSTLVMRHDNVSGVVSFRCPRCHPEPEQLSHQYHLDIPLFARVLGDLSQPVTALNRATAWSWEYFQAGAETGRVSCPRCGRTATLRPYTQYVAKRLSRGVYAECSRCAQVVCTSTSGVALASPAARRYLRANPRARIVRSDEVNHRGATATKLVMASDRGGPTLDLVVATNNVRLLQSRLGGAPTA